VISATTGQEVLPKCRQKRTVNGHTSHQKSKSSLLSDAIEMQKVLHRIVTKQRIAAKDKAACARAWETLADRIRILRGQPLPGQLRPTGEPKSKAARGSRGAEVVKKTPANVVDCGLAHATGSGQTPGKPDPDTQDRKEPVNTGEIAQ
jgi:hypothetical protein